MDLPKIKPERKAGDEIFNLDDKSLSFNLKEFWIWNQSNLIENRTRGILAEFIVKEALNIKNGIRIEWDAYDLITDKGVKVEIKSASYIQAWEQTKYSEIKFGIAPTISEPLNPDYDGKYRRWSDFYIFCILETKNQIEINPMNLNQWTFYVLKTSILNDKIPSQKTIVLNSLLKLNPIKCRYDELKNVIK